jgi:hypothetical protein
MIEWPACEDQQRIDEVTHECGKDAGHDGQHRCFCGETWNQR